MVASLERELGKGEQFFCGGGGWKLKTRLRAMSRGQKNLALGSAFVEGRLGQARSGPQLSAHQGLMVSGSSSRERAGSSPLSSCLAGDKQLSICFMTSLTPFGNFCIRLSMLSPLTHLFGI